MNLLEADLVAIETGSAHVRLPEGIQIRAAVNASTCKVGDKVTIGIRPEHMQLSTVDAVNAVPARVDLVEHLGDIVLAYIQVKGINEILCMKLPAESGLIKFGDSIHVVFPEKNCLLFDAQGLALKRV
jgi:multiple sugar transport system ATP-binding protein